MDLETAVTLARAGDREALARLVEAIQDDLYRLALRMLYHPEDAEDATQEILIKIVTNLAGFRGESAFKTWATRVACNHLLTTRKRRGERWNLTFETCEAMITPASADAAGAWSAGERRVLVQEMRLWCMQGLLLCLDRKHRMAFVLGTVFELSSSDAAALLEVTPANFRQRLSRARTDLLGFMQRHCGLLRSQNPCHCAEQLGATVRSGMIDPNRLLYATHPARDRLDRAAEELADDLDELGRLSRLFRDHPRYAAPATLLQNIQETLGHRA